MTVEILHVPKQSEPDPNQWLCATCACGCVFRLQRKDLNHDRRGLAWLNCPNHCGRTVSQFHSYG